MWFLLMWKQAECYSSAPRFLEKLHSYTKAVNVHQILVDTYFFLH